MKKVHVTLLCIIVLGTTIDITIVGKNMSNLEETKSNYYQEEVSYENSDAGVLLSGTLTLPDKTGVFPAIILIAGMGPNDRDYTMLGHKLFLVLAEYLTQQGMAVLRYDKRGVGRSTGAYDLTLTSKDFASDVLAGVEYLKTRKEIDANKIGLLGHSEGAIIAPMVAVQSQDVNFLVLLAGAASTSIESIIEHIALQLRADGAPQELIAADSKVRAQILAIAKEEQNYEVAADKMREVITNYLQNLSEELKLKAEKFPFAISEDKSENIIAMFNSPWYRYFLAYEPVKTLKQIQIPVLALNGDHDWITSSKIALPIISKALEKAGNKEYKVIELEKLNHWFQTCKTGALAEYGEIKETMSPTALQIISEWIAKRAAR